MNILITCPRAPAVLDWIAVVSGSLKAAERITLCDSLRFPVAAFAAQNNRKVRYCRIPAPRTDFAGYAAAMADLAAQADWVVPTCEDIFHLAHVPLPEPEQRKLFMPPRDLLLGLHHKARFFDYLPRGAGVCFPETRLLESAAEIDFSRLADSVFKPVYSRFGRQVRIAPVPSETAALPISAAAPWVQQQRIAGKALCSYAVCERGQVAAQVVYEPMYLINGSASTYFRRIDEPRIEAFVAAFAAQNGFHGQVAFDFIVSPNHEIYVIECNPRSTSGIHLLAGALSYSDGLWRFERQRIGTAATVSKPLWPLFARQVRREKTFAQVRADYAAARDVLADIPAYGTALSTAETAWRAWRKGIAFTDATTMDIEWNGAGQ